MRHCLAGLDCGQYRERITEPANEFSIPTCERKWPQTPAGVINGKKPG